MDLHWQLSERAPLRSYRLGLLEVWRVPVSLKAGSGDGLRDQQIVGHLLVPMPRQCRLNGELQVIPARKGTAQTQPGRREASR